MDRNFTVLVHSDRAPQRPFHPQQVAVFDEKALVNPLYTNCPAPTHFFTTLVISTNVLQSYHIFLIHISSKHLQVFI